MSEDVKKFAEKLNSLLLIDEYILDQKLHKYMQETDPRLIALINHQLFANQFKLTNYLKEALDKNPRASEPLRKKIINFISIYVETHYSYLVQHAKALFSQLLSQFWKEEGRIKEITLRPIVTIIESYEDQFLTSAEVLHPLKLHNDIMILLQTQKKSHGVIGECWHLLAVILNKFTTIISPGEKKKVQEVCFLELKKYVNQDSNLNTIASLLKALTKSLRENYLDEETLSELYKYAVTLMMPLKSTYSVPIAALELIEARRQLFQPYIMEGPKKLFENLRTYSTHKSRDFSLKSLEVLMVVIEMFVKVISANKVKYRDLFIHIREKINIDLSNIINRNKDEPILQQSKGLNLLTIIRLLGLMAPLYLQYQGKVSYKKIFNYIIKKCTKRIIKENNYQAQPDKENFYEIKYILYAQKELKSFLSALAQLIEQLEDIDYESAGQLQIVFIEAVKESKNFHRKYKAELWEAMVQLVMSMQIKGPIFTKWAKKIISESLRECLDSNSLNISNDDEYIVMIEKAAELWKALLNHSSWRAGALSEFSQFLMFNYEYLMLNLDCSYQKRNQGQQKEKQKERGREKDDLMIDQRPNQDDEFLNIFFMPNEMLQLSKVEDYQYLSSLSILFNEILKNIDPILYAQRVFTFYPLMLERLKSYPKSLPLLRTLRTLNEFILKNDFFKVHMISHKESCKELLEKMKRFFIEGIAAVFKYQGHYFYELLKILLSFSQEVYFLDNFRIIKSQLADLVIKTLQIGQEVNSLADIAVRCLKNLFQAEKEIFQYYLASVIPALQKYINVQSNSEKEETKAYLFLYQQKITRQTISEEVLSFLGSLGGLCHLLVDNKNSDHISWDFDCHLSVEVIILNEKYNISLTKILNRACWLAINGRDEVKIVACELIHAVITYVIEEIVSNKITKDNLSIFLDRILPTVLSIAGNSSHPSQQLIHTLLIQTIHFFANTKQPNSPDIQVILKHLLSLYNKSEDMGYLASKCLSQFIRWHIKQQPLKNGDVPILKALMSNIWSLAGNKNARQGIVSFLVKLLKIIHREKEIMNYYSLELGFLLLGLTRHHHPLESQFRYLIEKYTSCLNLYMKPLLIVDEGRKYKKAKNIKQFLEWLYKFGFFSIYKQQRETSYIIWHKIIKDNKDLLAYDHVEFLKARANKEKKYLFGTTSSISFTQVQETVLDKFSWRVVALGEIWLKMLQFDFFRQQNLIQFLDFEEVYLVSFSSFLAHVLDPKSQQSTAWNDQIQHSVITNFITFLKIINNFAPGNALIILGKFFLTLQTNNISEELFHKALFDIMYDPEIIIKQFNRDFLTGEQLKEYIYLLVNYHSLFKSFSHYRDTDPVETTFDLINHHLQLTISQLVSFVGKDQSSGERKVNLLLSMIAIAYNYGINKKISSGKSGRLQHLLNTLIMLTLQEGIRKERIPEIIGFILEFNYQQVIEFISNSLQHNNFVYQRFEKSILKYIQLHWDDLKEKIVNISLKSLDNIKLIYVLLKKLNKQQNSYFIKLLPQCEIKEEFSRDLLKINFILVQNQEAMLPAHYVAYLEHIVQDGLKADKSIDVHEESLYLCGLLLQKEIKMNNINIASLKASLNTLAKKYCPYIVSLLPTPEKQQTAMKYFGIVRNFIVISEEFEFIQQFFNQLRDKNLKDHRADIIEQLIQDAVRTCFTLESRNKLNKIRASCQMIMQYFRDENIDKDEWCNFRFNIIDKIFRKAMNYIELGLIQELFDRYIPELDQIIKRPLSKDSAKSLLIDFQIKKAALLMVQLLYGSLPRREKKQGQKFGNQAHKVFIKYCTEIVKRKLQDPYLRLIREHDQISKDESKKGMKVYREYNCYAYNCLIILFISTQSNKQHFKTFLFQNNKQALWSNLVDTEQTDFGFQIQTEFKIMKPYNPLRNKLKQIKSKIQKKYIDSSLFFIEEEAIPKTQLARIDEEYEDQENREKQEVPIVSANNLMLSTQVEEDNINKHPCMVNLLRVVDFLANTFPDPVPGWMRPIENYLQSFDISLGERILLIKLILNRPNIFNQPGMWASHLLYYLAQKQTGGKFIHYFYRDALKRYLKFLPDLKQQKPYVPYVNAVIMKLVRALPHENVNVYIDNVQMLEQLLKIPGVYVEKSTINKMLRGDEKDESKNEWRLCAIITLKLCLTYKVPILSQQQYAHLGTKADVKYSYYYQHIKMYMKAIFDSAIETNKKYRIAAAGFLGQYLNFIVNSPDLRDEQKKDHYDSVSQFLNSLTDKKSNRTVKQRFSLALEKIAVRFPAIFTDEKIFASFEDGLVHYTGQERLQLLNSFRQYVKSLLSSNESGKISNFFMILRVNWEKISVDSLEVQLTLLQLLNLCTDPRVLVNKDILKTYSIILEHFDKFIHENQHLANQYFLILINLKKFLTDKDLPKQEFSQNFLKSIEHYMVAGLTCKFQIPFKLLFSSFEKDVDEMIEADPIVTYNRIFQKIYTKEYQYLWLNNVAPLLLSLSKNSSDFKRLFSQTKLEDQMNKYDWDFRPLKINDASLPYTPFSMIRKEATFEKPAGGYSQIANQRGGLIRATQLISQEEQIFTMLESLSPSLGAESSQLQFSLQSQMKEAEEQQKYGKINDLFKNKRKRNELIDDFKTSNVNKNSAAVKFVEDKIRFAKKIKVENKSAQFRHLPGKEKIKKGAILRAYKLGELPNIEISLQNLIEPLIYLTSKDFQLSSEIFLQLIETVSSFSLKNCDSIKDTLVELIKSSQKYQFNFISTLQKGLIKMCQKHKKFFDLSLQEITIHSNTLDYAILFTEENLIQGAIQIQSSQSIEAVNEKKEKLIRQWSDLADYYQLLNEHDLIESVIIKLLEGENRASMIKALKEKRDGDLGQAKKIFQQLLIKGANNRLDEFISRQKIDCTVLLSEWDQICKESLTKHEDNVNQSYEEIRMYTIALENLEPQKRKEFLLRDEGFTVPGDKYEYERGMLCVMKEGGIDGAKYHALNSRQMFRKEWLRISSFAFNSKHELLQSLQKNYELIEFVNIYKEAQSTTQQCKRLYGQWTSRHPDTIFDDNITWIQILSSRLLFGKLLAEQHYIPAQQMARSITQWHVQVVNGMLAKGVLGYAENMIRRALLQHKLTRQFNWQFYESISKLKLLQLLKKGSLKIEQYSIVPKLIQKEMDQYKVNQDIDKLRLTMIKNEYFQGFLEVSLRKRQEMDYVSFVSKVMDTFNNYEQIRKGLKNCAQASEQFKREVHFDFAIFLENLLSIIRGKFEIKEIKESLAKNNYNIKIVAIKFIEELVYSIKILSLNTHSTLNYEQGQQVFSMILKLIKLVQSDYAIIGKYFEDAISDKQIPKWIFIYFIPQIIRNINNYDLSIHFKELFEYFLVNYPEALVYPFNCTYPRLADCHTDLAKQLYPHLHDKMSKYFQFINNLFLIQHPEMRLKDILTKYLSHGQYQNAMLQLKQFIDPNPYLGKYNIRFNENYREKILKIIDCKKRGQHQNVVELIKTAIASLDPSKCNMMKYFTKLAEGSLWFEEYNMSDWMKLEVPGITYSRFEQPLPWNKVFIDSFDNNILTLTSIRKPKRISILGSNEKTYMLLVKGGEDVRLDQRVEELFQLVNRIFVHYPETFKKQLKISRFEVIPMKPMFGVFEWVDKSQTLRSFLETELRKIKGKPEVNLATQNQAFACFVNYLNKICPGGDKYSWHKALMTQSEQSVVRNMNKAENYLPYGLLRYSLQRLAKNYDSFLHIKNQFINNYSALCLITYIFGIGDRHLENFLIQTSTGSVVMIDFGYSFGASIELPIPELIPFRLTRSFMDLCKPIGVEGAFKKCLLACYEALNKKMQLIVDYCDVFVDDPLMEWVWVSRKQLANSKDAYQQQVMVSSSGPSFSVSQQAPEKKLFTNKIKMVENKLKGRNPRMILEQLLTESRHKQANFIQNLRKAIWGKAKSKQDILSGEELISELLSLAGDKNITGRSYIGLNLFV